MLTKEEAIEFSIKKWKAIIDNDGNSLSIEKTKELGIFHFTSHCGLCEKYYYSTEYCINCPFNDNLKNGCSNSEHVWFNWYMTHTKESAQSVLNALIKIKDI